jgi:hypothetical protein
VGVMVAYLPFDYDADFYQRFSFVRNYTEVYLMVPCDCSVVVVS